MHALQTPAADAQLLSPAAVEMIKRRAVQSSRFAIETLCMQLPQTLFEGRPLWDTHSMAQAERDDDFRLMDLADVKEAVECLDSLGFLNRPVPANPHVLAFSPAVDGYELQLPLDHMPSNVGGQWREAQFQ